MGPPRHTSGQCGFSPTAQCLSDRPCLHDASSSSSHRAIAEAVKQCQPRVPAADTFKDYLLLSGINVSRIIAYSENF